MTRSPPNVDLLILGAGWTSQFLIPLLESRKIKFAATTTTGRDNTIKFVFDPDSSDLEPYKSLPQADTILITFPLKGVGQSKKIHGMYQKAHGAEVRNWIQLGSTGIYQAEGWNDHNSAYDTTNARAIAEDELIQLDGCVLNLAGLYGGSRDPKNWVGRVAKNKEQLKAKGAIHLIHGDDVALAILAVHQKFLAGERWIVADRHCYDWWDLFDAWGDELTTAWKGDDEDQRPQYRKWVAECMEEENVRALPRSMESLGRVLDSRDFWRATGVLPTRRLDR